MVITPLVFFGYGKGFGQGALSFFSKGVKRGKRVKKVKRLKKVKR